MSDKVPLQVSGLSYFVTLSKTLLSLAKMPETLSPHETKVSLYTPAESTPPKLIPVFWFILTSETLSNLIAIRGAGTLVDITSGSSKLELRMVRLEKLLAEIKLP